MNTTTGKAAGVRDNHAAAKMELSEREAELVQNFRRIEKHQQAILFGAIASLIQDQTRRKEAER